MNKTEYVKGLDLDLKLREAEGLLDEIAEHKRGQLAIKDRVRKAADKAELVKADLILTEEFKNLKPAEVRDAWLTRQKVDRPEYERALSEQATEQKLLDTTTAELDCLEKEYGLVLMEMRLIAAQLSFLAIA